jgi:hypothetical protein
MKVQLVGLAGRAVVHNLCKAVCLLSVSHMLLANKLLASKQFRQQPTNKPIVPSIVVHTHPAPALQLAVRPKGSAAHRKQTQISKRSPARLEPESATIKHTVDVMQSVAAPSQQDHA